MTRPPTESGRREAPMTATERGRNSGTSPARDACRSPDPAAVSVSASLVADEPGRHRPAADRQRLEEALSFSRQSTNAFVEYLSKRHSPSSGGVGFEIPGQLPQQERIATCLAGELQQLFATSRCIHRTSARQERARLIVSHRLETEADAALHTCPLDQRLQERL